MSDELTPQPEKTTVFEQIKRQTADGKEFWSSRELARVLDYSDYRNFEQVVAKAKQASFKSGQRIEDHFVDVTEMIDLPKGAQRAIAVEPGETGFFTTTVLNFVRAFDRREMKEEMVRSLLQDLHETGSVGHKAEIPGCPGTNQAGPTLYFLMRRRIHRLPRERRIGRSRARSVTRSGMCCGRLPVGPG